MPCVLFYTMHNDEVDRERAASADGRVNGSIVKNIQSGEPEGTSEKRAMMVPGVELATTPPNRSHV